MIFIFADAPLYVNIFGPTEARVADVVQLNCTTGASNPKADTRWTVDNRQVHENVTDVIQDGDNGWRTSSSIWITIAEKTSISVICRGVNSLLDKSVVASHTINVLCK